MNNAGHLLYSQLRRRSSATFPRKSVHTMIGVKSSGKPRYLCDRISVYQQPPGRVPVVQKLIIVIITLAKTSAQ